MLRSDQTIGLCITQRRLARLVLSRVTLPRSERRARNCWRSGAHGTVFGAVQNRCHGASVRFYAPIHITADPKTVPWAPAGRSVVREERAFALAKTRSGPGTGMSGVGDLRDGGTSMIYASSFWHGSCRVRNHTWPSLCDVELRIHRDRRHLGACRGGACGARRWRLIRFEPAKK